MLGGCIAALLALSFAAFSCGSSDDDAENENKPLPNNTAGSAGDGGSAGTAGTAGSAGTGGDKHPADSACGSTVALTVNSLTPTEDAGWYTGTATADGKEYTLRVELNPGPSYEHKPGSFDLATSVETDYATCRHCVLALEGGSTIDSASKAFFQVGGTMDIDVVSSPPSGASRGALKNVKLHEVTVESAMEAAVATVPDGLCFTIASYEWDTVPAAGGPCERASDCGDTSVNACDPNTKTCVQLQCNTEDETDKCGAGKLCLSQTAAPGTGACYSTCTPFDGSTSCASGYECVPLDELQDDGICLVRAANAEGSSCTPLDISTDCGDGLRCIANLEDDATGICRLQCEFWGGSTTCPSGSQCNRRGFCDPIQGDPAAIGQACAEGAAPYAPCGSDGKGFHGSCTYEDDGSVICRAACRIGSSVYMDCDENETCQVLDGEGNLPVCLPAPPEEP